MNKELALLNKMSEMIIDDFMGKVKLEVESYLEETGYSMRIEKQKTENLVNFKCNTSDNENDTKNRFIIVFNIGKDAHTEITGEWMKNSSSKVKAKVYGVLDIIDDMIKEFNQVERSSMPKVLKGIVNTSTANIINQTIPKMNEICENVFTIKLEIIRYEDYDAYKVIFAKKEFHKDNLPFAVARMDSEKLKFELRVENEGNKSIFSTKERSYVLNALGTLQEAVEEFNEL